MEKKLILLGLIFFPALLTAQDTAKVSKAYPNDKYHLGKTANNLSWGSGTVEKDSTYYLGREKAFDDIKNGNLMIRLRRNIWCPEAWVAPFEEKLSSQWGLSVKWNLTYTSLPRPENTPVQGAVTVFSFDDGYNHVMDSVAAKTLDRGNVLKLLGKYKSEYGVSAINCPDGFYRIVETIATPAFDEEQIHDEINEQVSKLNLGNIHGRIVINIIVSTDGKVLHALIARGIHPQADSLVSNYFENLEFTPCSLHGKLVPCRRSYIVSIE